MKIHPAFLPLFLLLLSPLLPAIDMPRGDVYVPGTAVHTAIPAADYQGHLLPALQDYHYCLRLDVQGRLAPKSVLRTYRHAAFDVARRYPHEVNDMLWRADGSWATPLSMAVEAQDAELVNLLLKLRALPFTPNAAYSLSDLAPLPGVAANARVNTLLHQARQRFNPLLILQGGLKGTGMAPGHRQPDTSSPNPTLRHLADTHENVYLGEPGVEDPGWLSQAFRRITGAGSTLLRVQPISRIIIQPGENAERGGGGHYGAIITTGRVVDALTGVLPTCEFITWEVAHEGPIDESPAAEERRNEPVFFSLTPAVLAKATLEDNHLQLGTALDGFDICRGERWQAAFDRVLADYPEKGEPLAATAEDLATARELMEEAPIILRANIFRYFITLDEEAGQVQVRYLATPRDPLKGALIKGALRDWGNLEYHRCFPISDEWRQLHADCKAGRAGGYTDIPVILALAPTDKVEESSWVARDARFPMKVLRAVDTKNDAPLFRALNEVAFSPHRAGKK